MAKILAMGKGLPTLDEVLMKAKTEEQAKLAQSKLAKGIKEAKMEVSVVDVYKAKTKLICKYCNRGISRNQS